MILRRLGNKSKLASKIQNHFPEHSIYIELFFGAGGMFFNKPKTEHNFLNDLDSDVYNLFNVLSTQKEDFLALFSIMPIHLDLFEYWKKNTETDPIRKAVRFVLLSNFSLYGKGDTLRFGCVKPREQVLSKIERTISYMENSQFLNFDFRDALKVISIDQKDKKKAFLYLDPPYLETTDNYSNYFKENDVTDLMDCAIDSKIKFAYSEFDHPFVINAAKERKLNIITIGERSNLKTRSVEILITNYHKNTLF